MSPLSWVGTWPHAGAPLKATSSITPEACDRSAMYTVITRVPGCYLSTAGSPPPTPLLPLVPGQGEREAEWKSHSKQLVLALMLWKE